jgi:hypothetical protein
MTSMVLGDSTLEYLPPSVKAPLLYVYTMNGHVSHKCMQFR